MTSGEFLALGETAERMELIDGVVTVSPRPSFRHQRVSFLIARAIDDWAQAHPGAHFAQDVSVELSEKLVYEPDVIAFAPGRYEREPDRVAGAPDLVIEISSPSTQRMDLETKRNDYERFGVKEYWIIDPVSAEARVFRREGARLVEDTALKPTLVSTALRVSR